MKFYDINISVNSDKEVEIKQANIFEDRDDCISLTKDMIVPVIHELETLLKDLNTEE